jgi:flagellar motor component MotA
MKKINSKLKLSQCLSITLCTGRKGSAPTNLYEFIFKLLSSRSFKKESTYDFKITGLGVTVGLYM